MESEEETRIPSRSLASNPDGKRTKLERCHALPNSKGNKNISMVPMSDNLASTTSQATSAELANEQVCSMG